LKTHSLNEKMRAKLKHPIGNLIVGDSEKTMNYLRRFIESEKPRRLFAVGDYVTLNMIKHGVKADLYVVDNKIMRKKIPPVHVNCVKTVRVANPPGTITSEASEAIRKAINSSSATRIVVDGEEDLLTLPTVKFAPVGTIVVYGQPGVGIVIVKVTGEKRREVEQILRLCAV
jgi:uncharacterized protein (UPF0218 family)